MKNKVWILNLENIAYEEKREREKGEDLVHRENQRQYDQRVLYILPCHTKEYAGYDLKRAGLPKRHQEHKQTLNIDNGKWKEERKDINKLT